MPETLTWDTATNEQVLRACAELHPDARYYTQTGEIMTGDEYILRPLTCTDDAIALAEAVGVVWAMAMHACGADDAVVAVQDRCYAEALTRAILKAVDAPIPSDTPEDSDG